MNSAELNLHITQEYESCSDLVKHLQQHKQHFIDCMAAPPPAITPPAPNVPIAASTAPLAAGPALSGAASGSGLASQPVPIAVSMTGQLEARPSDSTGQASSETQPNERAPDAPFMQNIALAMAQAAESKIQTEHFSATMSQRHGRPLHRRLNDVFDFGNAY